MDDGSMARKDIDTGQDLFRPYPEYKDSGVKWLGEVPKHWKLVRLKCIAANIVDQTSERGEEMYLALEHVQSWTGKIQLVDQHANFDSQLKRFQVGDVIFGKLRPYLAKVARPCQGGVCVGEFLVLRSHEISLSPHYLEHLLRSKPVIDAISSSSFGAKMPRADWQFVGNMTHPLPRIPEQIAIATYLDRETAKIDALVAKKERLIELFQEKRSALTTHAVTKGLDPVVPMKDSGVEWLGHIPAHWETARMWQVCEAISGGTPARDERTYWDGNIPWVSPKDMKRRLLDDSEEKITDCGQRDAGLKLIGSSQKSVHVERDLELKSMSSIRYLGVSTRPRYPRGNSCSLGVWSRQRSNCRGFE